MTDELGARLGFDFDPAGVEELEAATKAVSAELAKIGRRDQLTGLAREMALMAKATGDSEAALAGLTTVLAGLEASESEIAATTKAFLDQGRAIDQAAEAAQRLADKQAEIASNSAARAADPNENFDQASRRTGLAGDAASALNTIGGAAGAAGLGGVQQAAGAGAIILETIEAIPKLKAALAGVPDALRAAGEALGLFKTASEAIQGAQTAAAGAQTAQAAASTTLAGASTTAAAAEGAQAAAAGTLAGASGAAAGGIGAMLVSMAPIAAIGLAIAAALAGLAIAGHAASEEINKANSAYKAQFDAMREIDQYVISGATLEQAQARANTLNATVQAEQEALAKAQAAYDSGFQQLQNSIPVIGDFIARVADFFGAFSGPKAAIDETTKSLEKDKVQQEQLNQAIQKNEFAAGETSKAQEQAAQTTTQSQQTIATETQKSQSTAAAAAQEAATQIEQAAQRQQEAANRLGDAQAQANTKALDAVKDARTKLNEAQIDAQASFNRDIINLSVEAAQTRRENEIKSNLESAKAFRDSLRDQQKIRDATAQAETTALRGRDFLARSLAAEEGQRRLKEQADNATAAAQEKEIADKAASEQLDRGLDDDRRARKSALDAQFADNRTAEKRDEAAAREAKNRALRDALAAYQKEIDLANKSKETVLGIKTAQAQQEAQIASAGAAAALRASGSSTTNNTTIYDHRALTFQAGSSGGFRPIEKEIIRTMDRMGYGR